MAATAPVDTKTVQRRSLRFNSLAEVRADLDKLEAAHRAGRLKVRGNWAPGQLLGHLATWGDFAYDGYPPQLKAPWFIKLILRLRKNTYLRKGVPAGVHIPKLEGGTLGTEVIPFDQGLARLRRTLARYDGAPPAHSNIIFGRLTHEEWKALQMRHAELHLGFLDPG
jgi:hypothetical protein